MAGAGSLAWHVPDGVSSETLSSLFSELGPLQTGHAQNSRRTYFDTFDWRLFRRGECLEEQREAGGVVRLSWRGLHCLGRVGASPVAAPVLASDLPEGALRDRLEAVIEMRALRELTSLESRVIPLALLNKEEKTVLRLQLEEHRFAASSGENPDELQRRLQLIPLRGYEKKAHAAASLLKRATGFSPAGDLIQEALVAAGFSPGDYTSKVAVKLVPEMTGGEAVAAILQRLVGTMEANEPGIREGVDSEFLHDFRVAVRRTRSALGQLKGVFSDSQRERFKESFAWLGSATSRQRDTDVYLLALPSYRRSLPRGMAEDLDAFRGFLEERKKSSYEELCALLSEERYQAMMREWKGLLDELAEGGEAAGPGAARPVVELARERIRKAFRRAVKEGRAIRGGSAPEELHELRKTCKKLRYLLEFFQSLFSGKEMGKVITSLKTLQDNLGEYQDLHVQSTDILDLARLMEKDEGVPGRTFLAMGILVEEKKERQTLEREKFRSCFEKFDDPRNRRLVEALCAPRKSK